MNHSRATVFLKTASLTLAASFALTLIVSGEEAPGAVFADYADDYSTGTFPAGWEYLWNAPPSWDGSTASDESGGPITSLADYELLQPSDAYWTADGDGSSATGSPSRSLRLTSGGGHPGWGSTQGVQNDQDRYAIAAYTIQPGDIPSNNWPVFITDSNLGVGSSNSAGVEARVSVRDTAPVISRIIAGGTSAGFDGYLGTVDVGDTVYVGFGPDGSAISDGFNHDFSLRALDRLQPIAIADYRDDYAEGTFADNWQYMWNAPPSWDASTASDSSGGPITSLADLETLQWSGTKWTADGDDNNGNGLPAAFLQLDDDGGHPGWGSGQNGGGNDQDRYAIAAYAVPFDGDFSIVDSFLSTGGNGGSIDVRVFTQRDPLTPVLSMVLPNQANYEVDFDTRVGVLSAGEMIYVALGPNGSASADGFAWDFTIAAMAVPEPSSLGLALPLLLGLVPWRRRRR
jgi:hypothetical protein